MHLMYRRIHYSTAVDLRERVQSGIGVPRYMWHSAPATIGHPRPRAVHARMRHGVLWVDQNMNYHGRYHSMVPIAERTQMATCEARDTIHSYRVPGRTARPVPGPQGRLAICCEVYLIRSGFFRPRWLELAVFVLLLVLLLAPLGVLVENCIISVVLEFPS